MDSNSLNHDFYEEPSQTESAIDYSRVSSELLETGTMQAILDQNEDLQARLSVQMKRSAQLELRLKRTLEANDLFTRQNDVLVDTAAVAQEKLKSVESLFLKAVHDRDEVQKNFTELYAESRRNEDELRGMLRRATKTIERSDRYHKRIVSFVRPYISRLKESIKTTESVTTHLRSQEGVLLGTIQDLNSKLKSKDKTIARIENQFQKDVGTLTGDYESRSGQYIDELNLLKSQIARAMSRNKEMEKTIAQLEERAVLSENRAILFERRLEESDTRQASARDNQENASRAQLLEIQTRNLEIANLKSNLERLTTQWNQSENDRRKVTDELGKLRLVHDETLSALTKVSEREGGAQRLNVELSQNLKEYRQDVERLNAELARRAHGESLQTEILATHEFIERDENSNI